MVAQRHTIFRDKALKHYTEGRKKDILPNFSSLSAGLFAWVLLASMIVTGLVAWYGQVPVFLAGSGIVLGNGGQTNTARGGANALAFFAPEQATQLHVGDAAQVQVGASSSHVDGTIVQVLPGTTNLATALAHYGLNFGNASLQSQQVAVALINLGAGFPAANYTGSSVVVEVTVGTQSLFSALTGIGIS
ncbi:MAG TPA: hypothetical protein VN729_08815 [Ktedonobacteraceae bacterium]|nr:hypothetical protein [Ktedonobacteraceae bacterium]